MAFQIPFLNKTPSVAVLHLSGMIAAGGRGQLNDHTLAPYIEKAFSKGKPAAVALVINSPGGSPVQSSLIAARIRRLADDKKIPVYAFVEDVAASGGYWLACAGDEVYANESSIIGSIGVISGGFGFTELINKIGIERRLYVSGDKKSILDPFAPEKPADVKYLKSLQKEIHGTFAKMVKARRGKRLVGAEKDIFSGAFWTGSKALEIGLIDGIGDLRSVMRKRFGDKVRLRQIGVPQSFWRQRLGLSESLGNNAGLLDTENMATSILSTIEERLTWSRFGL